LCKIFQKEIDDPFFEEMDPVRKLWYYQNWIGDQTEAAELAKNHAYLLASFDHPDAIKQLVGGGNTHQSTDEEFEESSRMVKEINARLDQHVTQDQAPERKRRKRPQLKE
jgi:hypothetical protein